LPVCDFATVSVWDKKVVPVFADMLEKSPCQNIGQGDLHFTGLILEPAGKN
jgi:hypothetical protein